jgi:hypothetical protein
MRQVSALTPVVHHLRKAAILVMLSAAPTSHAHGQVETCSQQATAVFNQAISTYRTVLLEVLAAERSGRWRPTGTFRHTFFRQNARALSDIRTLLSRQDADEASLLRPFRRLVHVGLPRGARLSNTARRGETLRFQLVARDYLACRRQ